MKDEDFHKLERKVDVLEERRKSDKAEHQAELAELREHMARRDRNITLMVVGAVIASISLLRFLQG